jgi:hypothetical protein
VSALEDVAKTFNQWMDKGVEKDKDQLASYLSGAMYNIQAKLTGIPRKKKEL